MADQRLRALEREAARGDEVAAARLLSERLRRGDLTAERLRLAGYLGDSTARLALGPDVHEDQDVSAWTRGFDAWGAEVALRGVLALARAALPRCEARLTAPEVARAALATAEALLDAPSAEALAEARAAIAALDDLDVPPSADLDDDAAAALALDVLRELEAVVRVHTAGDPRVAAWDSAAAFADFSLHCARKGPLVRGDDGLREVLRADLVPWALRSTN